MSVSKKYGQNGKTFHVPFSKGTDSTDRKNWDYWKDITEGVKEGEKSFKTLDSEDGTTVEVSSVSQNPINNLIFSEKLDGQGNCIKDIGVFARSHGAPSELPWDKTLRQKWDLIKNDLKDFGVELFGEGMYARHSITYLNLKSDFYMFAVRKKDMWLSWEEVKYWAEMFDFPTVPEISVRPVSDFKKQEELQGYVESLMGRQSMLGSIDTETYELDQHEGIVFRNTEEFHVSNFIHNVFKIVRKGHVKTDEHWTRNWKKALFSNEINWKLNQSENDSYSDQQAIEIIKKTDKYGRR